MKTIHGVIATIFLLTLFATRLSQADPARRLIIQFSHILTDLEQAQSQRQLDALVAPGFTVIKHGVRWLLVLPPTTTPEQLIQLKQQLSQFKNVAFVEEDLPMKIMTTKPM